MAGIVCCEIAVRHTVAGVVSVGPICPGPDTKEAFEHRVEVIKKGTRNRTTLPRAAMTQIGGEHGGIGASNR